MVLAERSSTARSPSRTNGGIDREQLAELLTADQGTAHRFEGDFINIKYINVLDQPRKTFVLIPELAQSIADHGLLHPPILARFNRKGCEAYIKLNQHLWKKERKPKDLISVMENGEEIWYILLAGERRYKAFRHLETVGCADCQSRHGPGGCFERHLPKQAKNGGHFLEARVAINVSALTGSKIQFVENSYVPVPFVDEANTMHQYLGLQRLIDPNYSVAQVARDFNRGVEYTRNRIRFCELPESLRAFVEADLITPGIAIEMSRYQRVVMRLTSFPIAWAGLTILSGYDGPKMLSLAAEIFQLQEAIDTNMEAQCIEWANRAIDDRYSVERFKKVVTQTIFDLTSDQTMMQLFDEAAEKMMILSSRKKVFAQNLIWSLTVARHYMRRVRQARETKELGTPESQFSMLSPVRNYLLLVDELEADHPLMLEHLPKRRRLRVLQSIRASKIILEELYAKLNDGRVEDEVTV